MKKTCVVAMLLLALAQGAWAEINPKSGLIGVNVGLGFPMSANNFDEAANLGGVVGVHFMHFPASAWGLGLQANYFVFGEESTQVQGVAGTETDTDAKILTIEALGRLNLIEGNAIPYLVVGLGLNSYDQDTTTAGVAPILGSARGSSVGFTASPGMGIEFLSAGALGFGLEARYHIFMIDEDKFGADSVQAVSLNAKLNFHFGGE